MCHIILTYSLWGALEPWAEIALDADGFSIAVLHRGLSDDLVH